VRCVYLVIDLLTTTAKDHDETLPRSNCDFIFASFVCRASDVKEIRDSLGHINRIKNNLGSRTLGNPSKKASLAQKSWQVPRHCLREVHDL
jgi:hypothetical protein